MGNQALLVGSVPLKSVEEVMRAFGGPLGPFLPAVPDGEVGERRSWVLRLSYQVFNGHEDLETIQRPARVNGVEQLMPTSREDVWRFRVKPGVERVRFGNPGYRLGYAKDAVNSYFVFKTLREKGEIPPGVRFQISMPMVNSVVRPLTFPEPQDLEKIRPGYEEAIAAELEAILEAIPHEDLAIQWDCAWEVAAVYDGIEGYPAEREIDTHVAPVGRLSKLIPEDVALGFHFCFGTFGGWPRFAPADLGRCVELVNAAVKATGRRVDWAHIPALDRLDDAFYAPLANLDVGDTRVYLGLVHSMDSFQQRLEIARRYLPDFGVAAYCGFGRTPPEELPKVLQDHLTAIKLAGK
ncbi:MAG: hypothetical protein JWN93_3872 [Hyphomicrobiales bacterium]|nr:hypothetical protein [Hyphomicrobiales bacterium]